MPRDLSPQQNLRINQLSVVQRETPLDEFTAMVFR
jgi:hypothetical protein